jgi:rSAM/selenodomain-associated transferase 1
VVANRPTLILFARAPIAGEVKTRLAAAVGAAGAARLYRAFLEDAARIYAGPGWTPVLYADVDPDEPSLASLFGAPWRREAQATGDLGRRLAEAFRAEFARGAPAAFAVGSDHPALARRCLDELLDALSRGNDASLIPARDGGYCAIALSSRAGPEAAFDGIPWSSPDTFAKTLGRLKERGLSVAALASSYDVDRPEDLDLLREDLARRDPGGDDFPRSTAAALANLAAGLAR